MAATYKAIGTILIVTKNMAKSGNMIDTKSNKDWINKVKQGELEISSLRIPSFQRIPNRDCVLAIC